MTGETLPADRTTREYDPLEQIRTHIQGMPPYEPILPFEVLSQQLGRPTAQIIKLDANENPYGTLPAVAAALSHLPYAHIYPDPESRFLRQALASYHQIPEENILAGAGADELIDLTLRLFIEPDDAVINCPPTFGMYAFDGDLNRAHVINVWRKADFSVDLEGIEAAIAQYHPKLIFLAHPNNPDGSLLPRAAIERLLELPVVVVLDEAYMEFSPPDSSFLHEAVERKNLIVLRTFSKWGGLAGLRIGFGVYPLGLMEHLWKVKQPYNVSVAASTAAIAAIQHTDELKLILQKIMNERQRLFEQLMGIPWLHPYPSQSNFILCRVDGKDAALLKKELATQAGILVRYFNKPGLQNCVRISVGRPEHTDQLIETLKRMA